MSMTLLTMSPLWTTAGWTMLHTLWVGGSIGFLAVLSRRILQSASAGTRYGVALMFMLALAVSPVVIFVGTFHPDSQPQISLIGSIGDASSRLRSGTLSDNLPTTHRSLGYVVIDPRAGAPTRSRLDSLVQHLPWIWLCG